MLQQGHIEFASIIMALVKNLINKMTSVLIK